jgi:eukaryotic-like serine/threonine-protein kinase
MGPGPELRPGRVVAGRYRIERMLGSGGMGVVVAARHLALDRTVALKFLRSDRMAARDVERFVREAKLAASMRSEHVARILDAGSLDDLGRFMVLEYLEGADLARVLYGSTRLPVSFAAGVIAQACDALIEAHALGIVHRDIKPANLFLGTGTGALSVKVLDFGIAKRQDDLAAGLTTSDAIVGSPAYMAPEQIRQTRPVDGRSDLWSLGVVLYEAVAGHPPFQSSEFADLCMKILLDSPAPLPEECTVPSGLRAIIDRMLAKDPDDRFATATELRQALLPFAGAACELTLPPDLVERVVDNPSIVFGTATARELALLGSSASLGRPRRRRHLAWVAIFAAVGAAVYLGLRTSTPPAAAAASPPASPVPAAVVAAEPLPSPAPPALVSAPIVDRPAEPSPSSRPPRRPPAKRRVHAAPPPAPSEPPAWDPLASPY